MAQLAIAATDAYKVIDCEEQGVVGLQFSSIGSGFTFSVEATCNGQDWVPVVVKDNSNNQYTADSAITPTTAILYRVNSLAVKKLRVKNRANKSANVDYILESAAIPFDSATEFTAVASLLNMPSPRLPIWNDWRRQFTKTLLALVPTSQATIYHFSNAGNDSTGDGSAANPYATVAKAQTLMGNARELRFRYGDIYKEANGLDFVGRVGSIARAAEFGGRTKKDGKPIISKFQADYSAGGWTLTGGQTKTYQRTDSNASTIAWLREKNSVHQSSVYRRMTSIAEVEAFEGSWWATGTTVYIHPYDDRNPSSDGRVYESVLKNTIDGCHIDVNSDQILIENLRFDGWGCNPDSANAFYGIHVDSAGATKAVVIKECEAYYNGRHNIGLTSAGLGCQVLFYHVSAGWCTPTGDTPIVDYAASGHQVAVWEEPTIVAGNLPTFSGGGVGTCYPYASGCPAYVSHGNADTDLSILYKPRILDGPYGCGYVGSMQNAPDFSTNVNLCRAFVVDTQLKLRESKTVQEKDSPWSNASGTTFLSQGDLFTLHINCWFDMRCLGRRGGPANGVAFMNSLKGYYFNCVFDGYFDLDSHATAGGFRPMFWNSVSLELGNMWNCWINFRCRGPVNIGIEGQCVSNNNLAFCSPNMKFRNCVFTAVRDNGSTFYLGLNNNRDAAGALQTGDARSLLNNAYGCTDGKTDTYRGFHQDPYLIEIPTSMAIGRPDSDSVLVSANQQPVPGGGHLEYDMEWRPRTTPQTATARGPWEASN